MKKIFLAVIFALVCTIPSVVFASFGEIIFKTDDGFTVFSDGIGECDGFGFAVSDGERIIHLYNVGGDCSEPFAAILTGMSDAETEISQFYEIDGNFVYGDPYYVTDKTNIKTLAEIKAELIGELKTVVDKSLYRDAERQKIDEIIADAESIILQSSRRYPADEALLSAKAEIAGLKTNAQYEEEELAAAKLEAISEISGYLDKSLYREAEQSTIDSMISESTVFINSRSTYEEINKDVSDTKERLDLILTSAELDTNAAVNTEVVYYLSKAVDELSQTRFVGKGKSIINIVLPVMNEVASDGKYGRIVVTPEYVRITYSKQIADVKSIYNSMNEEFEKPQLEQTLAQLDMETQAFLKEYFL